jgi:hypothetical protein
VGNTVILNLDEVLSRLDGLPVKAQREVDEVAKQVAGVNASEIRNAGRVSRQAARASASVSASGDAITGGGPPYFFGSMFGGQGRPTTQQFKPFKSSGYWFWPTLKSSFPQTLEAFEAVVDAIAREWGR